MINSITISGNLCRPGDLKQTNTGKFVYKNSLAVFKDQETTNFFELEAWGETAQSLDKKCGKGMSVVINGKIDKEYWTDEKKNNREKVKIVVTSFVAMKRESATSIPAVEDPVSESKNTPDINDDDLPF